MMHVDISFTQLQPGSCTNSCNLIPDEIAIFVFDLKISPGITSLNWMPCK